MLPEEREYVRRTIASVIDHPSVYMGGPSQNSIRVAGRIMDELDRQGRLCSTTCTHDEYAGWDQHGRACPACGTWMACHHGTDLDIDCMQCIDEVETAARKPDLK